MKTCHRKGNVEAEVSDLPQISPPIVRALYETYVPQIMIRDKSERQGNDPKTGVYENVFCPHLESLESHHRQHQHHPEHPEELQIYNFLQVGFEQNE